MKSKITKIQILKKEITIFLAVMFMTTPIMTATTNLNINTNTAETNTIQNSSTEKNKSVLGFDLNEFLYGKVGSEVNKINKKLEAGETIIEISNEIQLRALAEIVNNENNGLKDITIVVTDNIIINSDEEWTPIGTQETPFEGNFVGGKLDEQSNLDTSIERCISNLKFTKVGKEYEDLSNVGLFGVIGEFGLIQNIVIDNFNIDILYESIEESANTYYYNAGNIAGINKGTIRNCINYSDIKGGTCVGGIVGYNEGKISDCINAGIIMGDDNTNGIAGQNIGKVENCYDINDMSDEEASISTLSAGIATYAEKTTDEKIDKSIDITTLFPKTDEKKDAEKTTVTYEIRKNKNQIKDKGYFKYNETTGKGETVTIVATIDRYFSNDTAHPTLKIIDKKGKSRVANYTGMLRNISNYTTSLTYEYEVQKDENFEVEEISLSQCKDIEAQRKIDTTTEKAIGVNGEIKAETPVEIIVDTTAPKMQIVKAYVDEKLETARYTAEKEVLFEVTISEVLDDLITKKPDIEVSFSKSGRGIYNYSTDKKKAGFAKYRSDLTRENDDGTLTWVYSYKIQEGDEGNLTFDVLESKLIDLSGNITQVEKNTSIVEIKDNWIDTSKNKIEDMDISYKVYDKSGKEITQKTNFKPGDTFSIEMTFDKVLYAVIGKNNTINDITSLLSKYPEYAPNLLLNNDIVQSEKTVSINEGKTKITYKYRVNDILFGNLDEKYQKNSTVISSIYLYNNSNQSLGSEIDDKNIGGSTPYCEKIYNTQEECKEHEEEINYIDKEAYKGLKLDFNLIIEPNGNEHTKYELDDIYADTTAPSVKITTDTLVPTNASEIIYTFEFSESVRDFTEEDITVNGGTIVKDSFKKIESDSKLGDEYGLKYEIKVKPLISEGKEGIIQVIVEKGACVDQVAKENIRQESNIKIDKVKPELISYKAYPMDGGMGVEILGIELEFNEAMSDAKNLVPNITIGENEGKGKWSDITYLNNKVIYKYNKDAADGGKVEISLTGTAKDLAGNNSDHIDIKVENDITWNKNLIEGGTENNVHTYYTFEKNGDSINSFSQATYFKAGDKITVNKHEETEIKNEEKNAKKTTYEYTITEEDVNTIQNNSKPAQILHIQLTQTKGKEIEFSNNASSDSINIKEANIYFDVIAPNVELSVKVNEPNINNVYTKGEELIIIATTSEAIQTAEVPEIRVSFTNSGLGKYNNGSANYQETITNEDGTTTWLYKYIAQNGDDGKAIIEFAKSGKIKDLAENVTQLKTNPVPSTEKTNLTDEIKDANTKLEYVFYKNGKPITDFSANTYFAKEDTIRIDVKFDQLIYQSLLEPELINGDNGDIGEIVPSLTIDDKEFECIGIVNGNTTTISYTYTVGEDEDSLLSKLLLKTKKELCSKIVNKPENEDEKETISYKKIKGTITEKNIGACNLQIFNSSTVVKGDVNIDTIKPTVSIKAQYKVTTEEGKTEYNTINGPTNLDKIFYTFEFSEEIKGFDVEDITVNGGTKGELKEETIGKVYNLEITPDVSDGNEGNVQVIIEKDSCTDKAEFGNIRAENNVKVDKKAPTLLGLEAYAPTDANIKLNEEINIAQEYYKTNATLKIVATFDESITTEAKLLLQFGEKSAKGEVQQEETTGNKITYTYTIVEGDEGKLSISSYRGKALDSAGNEITVTKRELIGDTIIADTTAPTLKELKVVSPDTGIYKAENKVTIEAIFDEEIYVLEENEIKLIDTQIEVKNEEETAENKKGKEKEEPEITYTNNAPTLIIKFGNGEERDAIVEGYGKKEDGSIDKTKIIYTYTIVEEHIETEIQEIDGEEKEVEILCPGDNGKLTVVSYENKENVEVSDMAGNVAELTGKLTGNEITADTIIPKVESVWAEVEEPIINNTGIYYKAGNIATIYVQFNEKIEPVNNEAKPQIKVYDKLIECDEIREDGVTAVFSYEITDGDNGYLRVKVPGSQFKDMAGNENAQEYYAQGEEQKIEKYWDCDDVYADTQAPYLSTNDGYKSQWKIEYIKNDNNQVTRIKATGIFNEKIFSMEDNTVVNLKETPKVELFINGVAQNQTTKATVAIEDGKTKLVYELDASAIDTTGTLSINFIDGTVYDRAGNKMSIELADGDIASPVFKDIKIVTPNGFYKEGDNIEIAVRFEEETRLTTVPTLKVKIGDKLLTLNGSFDSEDPENTDTIKVARYTHEIQYEENGALNIVALNGVASDGVRTSKEISLIYLDEKTEDEKVPEEENSEKEENSTEETSKVNVDPKTLLNSDEQQYANNQKEYENVIADTKETYVTKVEAIVAGKVIASYTKEEGKDAVINAGKTTANEIRYEITFSEPVKTHEEWWIGNGSLPESMLLYNGQINYITYTFMGDETEYFTKITVFVQPTIEGVQSLILPYEIFEDRAGNDAVAERFNIVTTDFTKPTIRVMSEYNGGVYVLPTNIGKVETRPSVEISEEISKIEYKWDDEEYVEIENHSEISDISIPTKVFTKAGTHVLSIRVADLAGNNAEASKTYEIVNSSIKIKLSTEELTNENVTATIEFEKGLTDNRKVTFKSETTGETVQLNAIGTDENKNSQYTITENGTIYVEATDKVGNKVFTEKAITNIDKELPKVEIDLDGANLVIGTNKDTATIKTNVKVEENKALDYAKYIYIQKDIDILNISDEDKAQINKNLNNEAKIEDAESTSGKTPYYLYVIATDKAGNETIEKAGPFTVLDTNSRTWEVENTENSDYTHATRPAEIEVSKLIAFEQEGKRFHITYNNFEDGEQYLNIIREKEITLSQEDDGIIDYENYSYVDVNKPTTIKVVGKDACGNEVIATYEVKREMIEGPEFEVYGNSEDWSNQDIKLDVYCDEELSALTVNENNILANMYVIVTENGDYKFIATDIYGMTSEKTIKVEKIDKDNPRITKLETSGKMITIIAEDATSGVERYAITDTTEVPVEWSDSKEIKVTHDGAFYAWAMDKAGNITRSEEIVTVDTTAPTITFNYTLLTVEAGLPIEANIITDEEAKISYSWDAKNWITTEEFITNVRVTKKYDITGKYTLYAKATDKFGNESKVQTIEFTVAKPEENVADPQIAFEGLYTTKVDGVHYVKVSTNMTSEDINNKMDKEKLYGLTPEYKNLTEEGKLKTGSEITLNGDTKYIVIINGDVNGDGKIDFLGDIISANNYRIGVNTLNEMQKLAADIDNDGKVEFISDILSMNNYRIGITNSL